MMRGFGSMSEKMATMLKIAGASRMNVVISGGTGSGKTTMLNALSKMIDPGERVITIEDAAELRLQQPHWLPLETRPANLEGQGAISIRDLVINALRMRPDRIILGEIRGRECFDLLAAMNTGHDGSMATLHSNSPRECLARMENMVMMSRHQDPEGSDQPADRGFGGPHRPGQAPPRRFAPDDQHHRGDRHGRRRDRHPGAVQVRISRRELPTGRSSANIARWACGPTRSIRRSSSASTSPTWRPASSPRQCIACKVSARNELTTVKVRNNGGRTPILGRYEGRRPHLSPMH